MDSEEAQRQGEAAEWSKVFYVLAGFCFAALCFCAGRASVYHEFRPWYAMPTLFIAAEVMLLIARRLARKAPGGIASRLAGKLGG